MIQLSYQTKRGVHVTICMPFGVGFGDEIEKLYRRRVEATAKDDNGEIVGEVIRRDWWDYDPKTKRRFRWTYWYDQDAK